MELEYGLKYENYKYIFNDNVEFVREPLEFVSGKRDWVAFQILLKGNEDFTVSVGGRPVFSPMGQLPNIRLQCNIDNMPGAISRMNPIGMVEDDDRVCKADMLLHNETVHVEKYRIQPVWVEAAIPEYVLPGIYTGRLDIFTHSMFENEKKIDTLYFKLEVKDVLLPGPAENRFHLDLWQHLSNIARKHEVVLWSNDHFKVIEEYVKSLSELGQKAVTVIASEIPWSGQYCFSIKDYYSDMFEYNMVRIEKDEEGQFQYDFSIVRKYVDLCFKYGIDKEIEVFGLINIWVSEEYGYGKVAEDHPDAIRLRYFDRSDGCYKFMRSAAGIYEYIKALEAFFKGEGLIDKVLVVADEPSDVDLYSKRLNLLKHLAPSFRYKTSINHAGFIGEFKDDISDFVPLLNCVCSEWELLEHLRNNIHGRLLWYVCCSPERPNTFICSPLLECRLIGILTAFMNLDGFLRWNYTAWPEKPRERISYKYPNWKAGDTNFVYPAWDGRPILTLRYMNLKRGIQDFTLIDMLKTTHKDAESILNTLWGMVLKTADIRELHPDSGKTVDELYSLNYDDYHKFKALLLEELS